MNVRSEKPWWVRRVENNEKYKHGWEEPKDVVMMFLMNLFFWLTLFYLMTSFGAIKAERDAQYLPTPPQKEIIAKTPRYPIFDEAMVEWLRKKR